HQPLRRRGPVLRNFFHKRLIIEPVDLLKLPIFGGELKNQRGPCAHSSVRGMLFGMNFARFEKTKNLRDQVFSVGQPNEGRQTRQGGDSSPFLPKIAADQRQAEEREQSRQHRFAGQSKLGSKQKQKCHRQVQIKRQQAAQRGRRSFAAVE